MTWTVVASGSQTASIGTEHTLTTDAGGNGTYYFETDITNMVNGDIVELRLYTMTLNGGTLRLAWKSTYGPAPPVQDIAPSPPQPSDQSIRATLRQTAGTGRIFPWKLLKV